MNLDPMNSVLASIAARFKKETLIKKPAPIDATKELPIGSGHESEEEEAFSEGQKIKAEQALLADNTDNGPQVIYGADTKIHEFCEADSHSELDLEA